MQQKTLAEHLVPQAESWNNAKTLGATMDLDFRRSFFVETWHFPAPGKDPVGPLEGAILGYPRIRLVAFSRQPSDMARVVNELTKPGGLIGPRLDFGRGVEVNLTHAVAVRSIGSIKYGEFHLALDGPSRLCSVESDHAPYDVRAQIVLRGIVHYNVDLAT